MEQTQQNNGEALEPEQAVAKAALLAECDRLAAAGAHWEVRGGRYFGKMLDVENRRSFHGVLDFCALVGLDLRVEHTHFARAARS